MPQQASAPLQRFLGRAAALLILASLLTGFLVAAAMTSQVNADAHAMLASHLNAMLGGFWLLGIAWSLPMLKLEPSTLKRLAWLAIVANYANWSVTAVKAFLKVPGVAATADAANNAIFAALSAFVVLPSLAAAAIWLYGFRERGDDA